MRSNWSHQNNGYIPYILVILSLLPKFPDVYKRQIAAEACKKGRVSINGTQVKPSRMIKPGEVIQVKKPPVTYLSLIHICYR